MQREGGVLRRSLQGLLGAIVLGAVACSGASAQSHWTPDVRGAGGGPGGIMPMPLPPAQVGSPNSILNPRMSFRQGNSRPSLKLRDADRDSLDRFLQRHRVADLLQWIDVIRNRAELSDLIDPLGVPALFNLKPGPRIGLDNANFLTMSGSTIPNRPAAQLAALAPADAPDWINRVAHSTAFQEQVDRTRGADEATQRVALVSPAAGFPLQGPLWRIAVSRTYSYLGLRSLNRSLLAYELNQEDQRNHSPLHTAHGVSVEFDKDASLHLVWHLGLETFRAASLDRQTWARSDPQTGITIYPRDEQEVSVQGWSLHPAAVYRIPWGQDRLDLLAGPSLELDRVRVRYAWDGVPQYDYLSDRTAILGVRVGAALSCPVRGPVYATASCGYKLVQSQSLSIGGFPWYWHASKDESAQARLDTSGGYIRFGLRVSL